MLNVVAAIVRIEIVIIVTNTVAVVLIVAMVLV